MTKADGNGATFRVGLIQMRSTRTPAANLDAAAKLVAEAKADGAAYVQTPEMTNILESKRDALMAAILPEERDGTLAAFRELARQHELWLHVGPELWLCRSDLRLRLRSPPPLAPPPQLWLRLCGSDLRRLR